MTTTDVSHARPPGRPGSGTLFGLAVGLLVGVLIAVLVAPDHSTTIARAGRGGADNPAGDASATNDAGGVTGGATAADAVTGAVNRATAASSGGTTNSRTGSGSAAGSPGSADGLPAGGSGVPLPSVRGVKTDSIRIGVALLDLGPIKALGPSFDNGDRKAHMESILAEWRRDHQVPVHGRNIEFVYRTFAVFTSDAQRSACVGFAQDDKVFAVIADSTFQLGMECLTREFGIPVVSADGDNEDAYQRSSLLFTLRMSNDRLLRNFVHWAHDRGILRGKKIGLYSLNDAAQQQLTTRSVRRELAKLGYKLAADVLTDNGLASPNDAVAVQRFRAAGVNLVLPLAGRAGFMQQAQAQGYHPQYIDTDWNSGTTDVALTLGPPAQWDGMYGMTGQRQGDWNSGIPPTATATRCTDAFRRTSGKSVDPKSRQAEWLSLVSSCDMANVTMTALQGAGRSLTPKALVAILETLRDRPMGLHPDKWSFGPGKHHGVDVQRTLRADAACGCWKVVSPFEPLATS